MNKNTKNDPESGIIEEYKTLRQETFQRMHNRTNAMAFIIAAISTLVSLVFSTFFDSLNKLSILLIICQFLILIGIKITTYNTYAIERIAEYIRKFIEPSVSGLNWETRWLSYRLEIKNNNSKNKPFLKKCAIFIRHGNLPSGESKIFTLSYFLMILGLLVVFLYAVIYHSCNTAIDIIKILLSPISVIFVGMFIVNSIALFTLYYRPHRNNGSGAKN